MKKVSSILALLLVAAMCVAMLAACSSSNRSEEQQNDTETTPSDETPSTDGDADSPEEPDEEEEELVEINCMLYIAGDNGEKVNHVFDAINAISEAEIGVHANIQALNFGDVGTQFTLAMAGGEQVDLIQILPFGNTMFNTMYTSSQLQDITDLLTQYAPETYALMEDYLPAMTMEGRVYGVPTYFSYAGTTYAVMRADMLDELGMTDFAKNMTTWTEYEQLLAAVKEQYTDIYGVGGQTRMLSMTNYFIRGRGDNFSDAVSYDTLGDSLGVFYFDGSGSIQNRFAMDEWENEAKAVADWYARGYVYPDASVTDDGADVQMKSGLIFSDFVSSIPGVEADKKAATGYDIVATPVVGELITAQTLRNWGVAVPVTSKEPEAAAKFINLMYTNAEVMNLLDWGEEGTDFVVVDGQANYPEGTDSAAVYHAADYNLGNQFLTYPWYGNGADFRQECETLTRNAEVSTMLGFGFDTSALANEIAAISSVTDEYEAGLCCGLYTESTYADFLSQLEAAGVQTYIDTAQAQLDAYLAG